VFIASPPLAVVDVGLFSALSAADSAPTTVVVVVVEVGYGTPFASTSVSVLVLGELTARERLIIAALIWLGVHPGYA